MQLFIGIIFWYWWRGWCSSEENTVNSEKNNEFKIKEENDDKEKDNKFLIFDEFYPRKNLN